MKGIASIILNKLAEAARENGLLSLTAYILPRNTGMIKLFKKLSDKITTKIESEMLILSCNFNEEN